MEQSSVCVGDAGGRIIREAKVASAPEALVQFLKDLALPVSRLGLEAGPLSQWLYAGLTAAGFAAVLLETRHVKAALSARVVKTDRKDARGIAQLLRRGWFRPVHCKSPPAQEVRALLVARKPLQAKRRDVELGLRGLLRGFGLKVGEVGKGPFAARVRDLVAGHPMLERIAQAMLRAREGLREEFAKLHRAMLAIVRADTVCRRLMTVPRGWRAGCGDVYLGDRRSATVRPLQRGRRAFGLTPEKYQSGERDISGAISKVGDALVRTALYEAARVMLTRAVRFPARKRWAIEVAKRRGLKRAKVALARKLAVVMHAMWRDGTAFRWGKEAEVG